MNAVIIKVNTALSPISMLSQECLIYCIHILKCVSASLDDTVMRAIDADGYHLPFYFLLHI